MIVGILKTGADWLALSLPPTTGTHEKAARK